jgi:hypothetical protein
MRVFSRYANPDATRRDVRNTVKYVIRKDDWRGARIRAGRGENLILPPDDLMAGKSARIPTRRPTQTDFPLFFCLFGQKTDLKKTK